MPTISVFRDDLEQLLGSHVGEGLTPELLDRWVLWVKGEIKDYDRESGEYRIELQDSNRPDLWCCEGIARQIRTKLAGSAKPYPFFKDKGAEGPPRRIQVSAGLDGVRPFIAACTAVGWTVTERGLAQLIQTQEKIADIYGRKRSTVSLGIYRLSKISFPVTYALVKPEEVRFTPLGFSERMTPGEILAVHPKGIEFAGILAGQPRVPLLIDDEGQVLSMPPIINSREIGEVCVGDTELFVEVTGTDMTMVLLAINILAANLADRGASIGKVELNYPYDTKYGRSLFSPYDISEPRAVSVSAIEKPLGQELGSRVIKEALQSYGYQVSVSKDQLSVTLPPYRNDLMHAVDVMEDVAISRGYDQFHPVMPSQFTVGSLSAVETVADRVRDYLVGMGFQEMMSNILASKEELVDKMRLTGTPWGRVVELDNVMTQSYSCVRQSLLPSLFRVEGHSTRAFYPHRLFEVDEAVIPSETGAEGRTIVLLGALTAHADANFSEAHSYLDWLCYYLNLSYVLEPVVHPSFLEGRVGRILMNGVAIGVIGEVHPEVLERWQVTVPVSVFELSVSEIAERLS